MFSLVAASALQPQFSRIGAADFHSLQCSKAVDGACVKKLKKQDQVNRFFCQIVEG